VDLHGGRSFYFRGSRGLDDEASDIRHGFAGLFLAWDDTEKLFNEGELAKLRLVWWTGRTFHSKGSTVSRDLVDLQRFCNHASRHLKAPAFCSLYPRMIRQSEFKRNGFDRSEGTKC
jgi:hypothetical protein